MDLFNTIDLYNDGSQFVNPLIEKFSSSKPTANDLESMARKIDGFKKGTSTLSWRAAFQYDKKSGSLILCFPHNYDHSIILCTDKIITVQDVNEVVDQFSMALLEYRK